MNWTKELWLQYFTDGKLQDTLTDEEYKEFIDFGRQLDRQSWIE